MIRGEFQELNGIKSNTLKRPALEMDMSISSLKTKEKEEKVDRGVKMS